MASQKHTKALFVPAIAFYSEWVVLFCSVIWAILGYKGNCVSVYIVKKGRG